LEGPLGDLDRVAGGDVAKAAWHDEQDGIRIADLIDPARSDKSNKWVELLWRTSLDGTAVAPDAGAMV
jgi:hypothetical protein